MLNITESVNSVAIATMQTELKKDTCIRNNAKLLNEKKDVKNHVTTLHGKNVRIQFHVSPCRLHENVVWNLGIYLNVKQNQVYITTCTLLKTKTN